MKDVVTVAALQLRNSGDWEKDRSRLADRFAFAAEKGASLLVLPELFGWRWFAGNMDKNAYALADTLDGERIAAYREMAAANKIACGAPLFLHDGQGLYHNAVVVIDNAGEVAGVYRSVHLPQIPGWEGKFYFAPGEDFPIFQLDGLPVGFVICWDVFFPEAFRALALKGARVIIALTSATGAGEDLWIRALSAQAFFNGIYVVRINRVGEEEQATFSGHSFCAAPTGDLLGDPMGDVEGLAFYEIDRRALELTRREFPFLKDRRPRAYLELANLAIRPSDEKAKSS
jgi:N-carbamoylputrescine amidase